MRPGLRQPRWRRPAALAVCALLGCGGQSDLDEIAEFDIAPARPLMAEIEFGAFSIPVPDRPLDGSPRDTGRNFLQLQFTLLGVVEPADRAEIERLVERRGGELRDRVIRVCRNATLSDLQDHELVTLKLRMLDATQSIFEGLKIDTLLVRDLDIDSL